MDAPTAFVQGIQPSTGDAMPRTPAPQNRRQAAQASPHHPSAASTAKARTPLEDGAAETVAHSSAQPSPTDVPGWAGQLRLPLSWSLQTLMLMLHAGEEWQRAQLDCWHLALKRHEHAHQRLLACEDTAEMASVHADLLRFDSANLTQLAQRYMDTGVHLNTDLARLIAQTLDGSRHQLMRSGFEAFQSGLRTGFRPLDEIFSAPILRELMTPKPQAS
jgi:hypothetical protein